MSFDSILEAAAKNLAVKLPTLFDKRSSLQWQIQAMKEEIHIPYQKKDESAISKLDELNQKFEELCKTIGNKEDK
jgi:hypothetical protein